MPFNITHKTVFNTVALHRIDPPFFVYGHSIMQDVYNNSDSTAQEHINPS